MPLTPFRKMNGLGNDFLVVDARAHPVRPSPEVIRALADRASGVGFDQFITIERGRGAADAFMRIDNADGGEVEACGNATRCVGRLLMAESGKDSAAIETVAGLLFARPAKGPSRPAQSAGDAPRPVSSVGDERPSSVVIAGLDPPIHSVTSGRVGDGNGMDARIKSGHDDSGSTNVGTT